jgi:carboxymethylenebutenolidase
VIAVPESGSGPGVIVIQEWWGLVPHIVDVTERLARAGFVALAVDHYRGVATTEPDEAQKLMMGLNIERVARDLREASEHLAELPEVTDDGIGVIGFCMGGGLALLAPTVAPRVCCSVAFYPAMPWPHYAPDWSQYAGKVATIHKAESDEAGTGAAIAEYSAAIVAAGGSVEIFDYPGSVHAFFNDDRPEVFQQANAELAWERTIAALRSCGC